jgi:hypothetical protein
VKIKALFKLPPFLTEKINLDTSVFNTKDPLLIPIGFWHFSRIDGSGDDAPPEIQEQAPVRTLPQGNRTVHGGGYQVWRKLLYVDSGANPTIAL